MFCWTLFGALVNPGWIGVFCWTVFGILVNPGWIGMFCWTAWFGITGPEDCLILLLPSPSSNKAFPMFVTGIPVDSIILLVSWSNPDFLIMTFLGFDPYILEYAPFVWLALFVTSLLILLSCKSFCCALSIQEHSSIFPFSYIVIHLIFFIANNIIYYQPSNICISDIKCL